MKQKIDKILALIKLHPKRWAVVGGVIVVLVVSYVIAFLPRTIHFAYAGDSCISQVSLLPQILKSSGGDGYEIRMGDDLKIGNFSVLSRSICVSAITAPDEGRVETISVSPFGGLLARKDYRVAPGKAPEVAVSALSRPIPATKPLALKLSAPDELFTYVIASDLNKVKCSSKGREITCDTGELGLEQGKTYHLSVDKYFGEEHVKTIVKKEVSILPAAVVKSSSVTDGQIVYDKPASFTIEIDKPIKGAQVRLLRVDGDKEESMEGKVATDGSNITFTPDGELTRSSDYRLSIDEVDAIDGSGLSQAMVITFKTSGGPSVGSINIGRHSVDSHASIIVTFDQPIKSGQGVEKYVSVAGVGAVVSQSGDRTVRIALQGGVRCSDFTITVAKGILSNYDIESTSAWQYVSRTRCASIESIGQSAQGRSILSYIFGAGPTTYLFTGAIHGNEISSKYTMDNFVADLEANPSKVPAGARVVIVPAVNPDGVARAMRNNARNVNLNRNFPAPNWVSDTTVAGGRVENGAGGASAGSEPETQALINLTNRFNPRLVVTHHSQGYLVNTNDIGISTNAGREYARLAGYRHVLSADTGAAFGFEMTGTYEDWLYYRGTPVVLVELDSHTGNHYNRNSSAMWAMLRQ